MRLAYNRQQGNESRVLWHFYHMASDRSQYPVLGG